MAVIESGLDKINKQGFIEVIPPSELEKEAIKTTIKQLQENVSFFDFMTKIFDELEVLPGTSALGMIEVPIHSGNRSVTLTYRRLYTSKVIGCLLLAVGILIAGAYFTLSREKVTVQRVCEPVEQRRAAGGKRPATQRLAI